MNRNICSRPTTVTSGLHYVLDSTDEQIAVQQQQIIAQQQQNVIKQQQQLLQNGVEQQQTKYSQIMTEVVIEQQQQQDVQLIPEQQTNYLLNQQQQQTTTTMEFHQSNEYSNYMATERQQHRQQNLLDSNQHESELFEKKPIIIEKEEVRGNRKRFSTTKPTNFVKHRREMKKAEHLERINNNKG